MNFLRISEEQQICKYCLQAGLVEVELFRLSRRAKIIADFVLGLDGLLDPVKVEEALSAKPPPPLGLFDNTFFELVKRTLQLFLRNPRAELLLKRLNFPLANPFIETLIRNSLLLPAEKPLTKRDISLALLVALMTPLRQSVGSCFATAPLIRVQMEEGAFLLQELYDLLTRGSLKRTIEGEEVKVPVSTKTGSGDLLKRLGENGHLDPALRVALGTSKFVSSPFDTVREVIQKNVGIDKVTFVEERFKAQLQSSLLKSYEYTVASFADWKIDFYKWNIYASLGLSHEAKGGIGEAIYQKLDFQLQKTNEEMTKLYEEIVLVESQIRMQESLLQNAYKEDQIRRHKVEIQVKSQHLLFCEDLYRKKRGDAEKLSTFFSFLIDQIVLLFPFYFQEAYDPDMFVEEGDIYEDRPAGFRLLFKHGRADPTVWTMIYTKDAYKKSLIEFFTMIEPILVTRSDWEEGKDLIQGIMDQVIERIKAEDFVKIATNRLKEMHQETMRQTGSRLPWAYTSGGNVEAFIKCYYSLKKAPTKHVLKPKSPQELLESLIELMKDLPYKITNAFEKDPYKSILITNEVHAFLFKPGFDKEFLKSWSLSGNTFTYVRDNFIEKTKQDYHRILSDEQIRRISGESLIVFLQSRGVLTHWIIGDSNWGAEFLGILLHPKTEKLELWRIHAHMNKSLDLWNHLFDGSEWVVYANPDEYVGEMRGTVFLKDKI